MSDLETALLKLAAWLAGARISYMVIDGFANLVWGEARLTRDVDVTIAVPPDRIDETVSDLAAAFPPRVADPIRFVSETRVLPVTIESIPVDMIFAGLPYEEEAIARARPVTLEGGAIMVCSPDDLILHKIVSPRPRDHEDVAGVFRHSGSRLDFSYLDPRIEELASALDDAELGRRYRALKARFYSTHGGPGTTC